MSDKDKEIKDDANEDTRVEVEITDSSEKADKRDDAEKVEDNPENGTDSESSPTVEKTSEECESERYMRLAAEFENYKKRTAREFEDVINGANARLLRQLIEVIDNFERALADENGKDSEAYRKGVELIYQQFLDLLHKENVTPIAAVGEPFDPNLHEAMLQQPSDEYPEGIISQEFQRGYKLGQKILRHSRVIVSTGTDADEK